MEDERRPVPSDGVGDESGEGAARPPSSDRGGLLGTATRHIRAVVVLIGAIGLGFGVLATTVEEGRDLVRIFVPGFLATPSPTAAATSPPSPVPTPSTTPPVMVVIPDLMFEDPWEAAAELENLGLRPEVTCRERPDGFAPERVWGTDPDMETEVPDGSEVIIIVEPTTPGGTCPEQFDLSSPEP